MAIPTQASLAAVYLAAMKSESAASGSGALTDESPGSVNVIMANSSAYQGMLVMAAAVRLHAEHFFGGASGQALDKKVNDVIPQMGGRNLATPSGVTERLSRTTFANGAGTIPKGFLFAAPSTAQDVAVQFSVDSDTAVGATDLFVDLLCTSTTTGLATVVAIGKITQILSSPYDANFNVATNAAASAGGSEDETDDAFRARAISFWTTLAMATTDALEQAALAVAGVFTAVVVDREDSTFDLVIADAAGGSSPQMIINVRNATEGPVKAAGAAQNTLGSTAEVLTIAATATWAAGVDQAQGVVDIKTALKGYVNTLKAQEQFIHNTAEAAVLRLMGDIDIGGDGRLTDFSIGTPTGNSTPTGVAAFHSEVGDIAITSV